MMKRFILVGLFISSFAQATASERRDGVLRCRSQFTNCEYQCPRYHRYDEGCLPLGDTSCRPTGKITYVIPSGETNGYLVAFDIDANFPELLCVEVRGRRSARTVEAGGDDHHLGRCSASQLRSGCKTAYGARTPSGMMCLCN